MELNFKTKVTVTFLLFILPAASSSVVTDKVEAGTRIVISTSGPVKFNSYWSENPPRLVVEFQSRNILSKIDDEVIVDQGVIKKITSAYLGKGQDKSLKSLTFELIEKVPYKIHQEGNAILLDIQAPLEASGFSIGAKGKEVFIEGEVSNTIKRSEAIDTAVMQVAKNRPSLENAETKATQGKIVSPEPLKAKGVKKNIILWFIGLVSISGLGFALWRKYVVVRTKNLTERIRKIKLELEGKDKLLKQVEIIRKTIEKTAIAKEGEYEQLKLELQEKNTLFTQEEAMRKEKEKTLLELEKQYERISKTSESLKDVLIKRGIAKELTLPGEKGELWILGKSQDRRNSPRLFLTKDFHNTVILKIGSQSAPGLIKSFAENISSGGLCFKTSKELDDRRPVSLKLFFYGSKVPNFKTQGWIAWKRTAESTSYYGVSFDWQEDKDKLELNRHIESKIGGS